MSFLFYYPNRPTLMPPDKDKIDAMEKTGEYVAEKKFNGDNILIHTDTMEIWNRKKTRHRFVPSPAMREELEKWPKHSLLNAELMNYRTKLIKDIVIIHCVMAWKGKLLIGKTWGDSRKILDDQPYGAHVKVSPVYKTGFWNLFQEADGQTIEGIIIKKLAGKLIFSCSPIADTSFMFKFRKPCKKYLY
jgi:hypothetical protein